VIQQARNLLMNLDGQAVGPKLLTQDRDAKFTAAFDAVFTSTCVRIIKTPSRHNGRAGKRPKRSLSDDPNRQATRARSDNRAPQVQLSRHHGVPRREYPD